MLVWGVGEVPVGDVKSLVRETKLASSCKGKDITVSLLHLQYIIICNCVLTMPDSDLRLYRMIGTVSKTSSSLARIIIMMCVLTLIFVCSEPK